MGDTQRTCNHPECGTPLEPREKAYCPAHRSWKVHRAADARFAGDKEARDRRTALPSWTFKDWSRPVAAGKARRQ